MMCSIVGPLNSHLWFMAIFIVDARHHSRKLLLESQSLGGGKCKKQKQNVKKRTDTGNTDGRNVCPDSACLEIFFSMWIKSDIHQLLLLRWIKAAVISGPLHLPCSLQLLTLYVWLRSPSPSSPPWMLACQINHSRTPLNVPEGTLSPDTISQSVTRR